MSDTPDTDAVAEYEGNWDTKALRMTDFARRLERERDEWKAAHDNQVSLKRIISDRPDLKERAKLVAELIEERDGWREAAYSLGEAIPASWESLQPPAAQLVKFKEMVKLQHEKYDL